MILSVICPTYNEERYIAQTLESFISQQYHSFRLEILIVDGRSTDRTCEIVERYAIKYPNIRLVDNPDRKTPFAFNAGLRAASGAYIALLGAHTRYDDNYLQVCYDELLATGSVGCTGRVITRADGNNFGAKLSEWTMLSSFGVSPNSFRIMPEGYVHSVNFPVFKKEALLSLGGYDTTLERNQDNDMNQRLLDAGHKLYCTWKTRCFYHPPANVNKLFKYGYRSGFWNAKSFISHTRSMRSHHLIPFVFTAAVILSLAGGLATFIAFQNWYLLALAAVIITMHIATGILFALRSLRYESDGRKLLLPFVFFAFHFVYGWGTLNGFLKRSS